MSDWKPRSRVPRSVGALLCCALAACISPRVQIAGTAFEDPRLEADAAVMQDGARLALRVWESAAQPLAIVVAVHGLNDYSRGFASTGAFLAARGFTVYAFDQRGFGLMPQTGIWAGGERLADDAFEVARLLRLRHPGVPLYALGESMGAAVLLHALQRHRSDWLDAVVLSAPAVWNRGSMRRYQRLPLNVLSHSLRGLKFSGRMLDRRPTDDPAALSALHDDPLVIHRTRVDVLSGIADLMDAATSEPVEPGMPVLVLYGAHDEIVPPEPVCAWLETLPASGWQAALYPSGWHLLTRSLDAARVLGDLVAWFERPGTSLPSGADTAEPVARICALGGA
jgi:acylglycerol lipase